MRQKYILILLMGLINVYTIDIKSQDHYIVIGSALNIRDGAGVKNNIIGQLNIGDKVSVYEITGDWAKISFGDKEGYVNKNYLQLESQDTINKIDKNSLDSIWIWMILATIIFIWITAVRYSKRCKSCSRWNAMRVDRKELVDEKPSNIRKSDTITDAKGNKHINYYSVPATIYYYHVHRKCKHCGYRDYINESKKVEN